MASSSSTMEDYEIITDPWNPRCVSACVLYLPGKEPEEVNRKLEKIRGKEENLGHNHTLSEEYDIINEQIKNTQGFDVDFSNLRYFFDFYPAFLDESDMAEEPETDGEYFGRLAAEAIEGYNKREGTRFEFLEVEKANIYLNSGDVFFITFVAKDPACDQSKVFQAKVTNVFCREIVHSFCRLKPGQQVTCGVTSGEDSIAEKTRYQSNSIGDI